MKIALAQLLVTPGQPSKNFERMQRLIEQARVAQCDIIAFPEMAVSGYVLGDLWLDNDYQQLVQTFNDQIKALSHDIGIIWGNLWTPMDTPIKRGTDGRSIRFNTAFFAYKGEWVARETDFYPGHYVKHLMPDYRVFDDHRYFHSAAELPYQDYPFAQPFIFRHQGTTHRIGIEICEDLWSDDYQVNVSKLYKERGADLVINISSSPWTLNKEKARHRYLHSHASLPLLYINACGVQNNGKNVLIFDGGSSVYNASGICIASANEYGEEQLLITDLIAVNSNTSPVDKLRVLLTRSIKLFDEQNFNQKMPWVIGLSGGIDSSVNAALLVSALGKERVIGYNLATKYNSKTTISNAERVAQALDIPLLLGDIEGIVNTTKQALSSQFGYETLTVLTQENLQARTRGLLLTTFAQIVNGVVCNNGNKLEIALGYCTLYGDTIGALSPLGDLTKVQIGELATQLNLLFNKEVVPTNLIPLVSKTGIKWVTAPSAELKENQIDPMKWGYHDWLLNYYLTFPQRRIESFMEMYLNESLPEEVVPYIRLYGLDSASAFIDDLEWFLKLIELSVFKRIQMPPIVMVSRGAFGFDYRESQLRIEKSAHYVKLREQILLKSTYGLMSSKTRS